MRANTLPILSLFLAATSACLADASADDVCAEANQHISDCLGESAELPVSCDADAAGEILAQSCEEIAVSLAKGDGFIDRFLCGLGFKCHCDPEPAPDVNVIDDSSDRFGCGGPCRSSSTGGYEGSGFRYALSHHGAHATYRVPIPEAGRYVISAYMPAHDGTGDASYAVNTCSGFERFYADQTSSQDAWVELGDFTLEPGAELRLGGHSGNYFSADAIRVERIGD